jgi:chromate reductase
MLNADAAELNDLLNSTFELECVSVLQDFPITERENKMSQYQIAVVVGSLRKDSFNRKLANAVVKLAPPEFTFKQLQIGDLPLYNQDDDANPAASVKRLKSEIVASQGLLFVTPEYNRSLPGVLKNAIDHASRPYGQSAWAGKPAGVLGISPGAVGTALAQQHLRNILAYLDVPTLGQTEAFIQMKDGLFDAAGELAGDSRKFLQAWMDKYVAWVKKHSA